MKFITVEEHFTSQEIIDANNKFRPVQENSEYKKFYESMVFVGKALTDIEEIRLPFMDKNKIDMQVLSYTSPVSDNVPAIFAGGLMKFLCQ